MDYKDYLANRIVDIIFTNDERVNDLRLKVQSLPDRGEPGYESQHPWRLQFGAEEEKAFVNWLIRHNYAAQWIESDNGIDGRKRGDILIIYPYKGYRIKIRIDLKSTAHFPDGVRYIGGIFPYTEKNGYKQYPGNADIIMSADTFLTKESFKFFRKKDLLDLCAVNNPSYIVLIKFFYMSMRLDECLMFIAEEKIKIENNPDVEKVIL